MRTSGVVFVKIAKMLRPCYNQLSRPTIANQERFVAGKCLAFFRKLLAGGVSVICCRAGYSHWFLIFSPANKFHHASICCDFFDGSTSIILDVDSKDSVEEDKQQRQQHADARH